MVATVVWGLFGLPFIYLNRDWLMQEAVGFFTFLLVVVGTFQLGLFVWQLWLIRKSLDDTTIAAKAAKTSADTAKLQAEVARDTLKTMQDTAERQLRAYVRAKPLGIIPHSERAKVLAHIAFENTGQIWASNFFSTVAIKTSMNGHLGAEDIPIDPATLDGTAVIAPRSEVLRGTKTLDVSDLSDGWVYVWGMIRYDDGFKTGRVTRFCHRYPCRQLIAHPEGGHQIDIQYARYHENGNEAD
jgi:hypothetical protein